MQIRDKRDPQGGSITGVLIDGDIVMGSGNIPGVKSAVGYCKEGENQGDSRSRGGKERRRRQYMQELKNKPQDVQREEGHKKIHQPGEGKHGGIAEKPYTAHAQEEEKDIRKTQQKVQGPKNKKAERGEKIPD